MSAKKTRESRAKLPILNATCPLGTKLYNQSKRFAAKDGQRAGGLDTQTTLSMDDTGNIIAAPKARFTDIQGPDIRDICYATQNRQSAVRNLSKLVDVILVVGAGNNSNSNRLREIGPDIGVARYLIADGGEFNPDWLKGAKTVGITAGASALDVLVDDVIDALKRSGRVAVSVLSGRKENIEFRLPSELVSA